MSSVRFPGKMLAPFRGRPLIAQVLGQFDQSKIRSQIVVLTSSEPSDDPLADYVESRCSTPVFRGDLDDVVARFQSAIVKFPCEWFVRISGDSPLIDASLVQAMIELTSDDFDIVSNVVRRTFPSGQSVECIRSCSFLNLVSRELTSDQREHVTKVFYDRPRNLRARSVVCSEPKWMGRRMVVDSLDDLKSLDAGVEVPESFGKYARPEI